MLAVALLALGGIAAGIAMYLTEDSVLWLIGCVTFSFGLLTVLLLVYGLLRMYRAGVFALDPFASHVLVTNSQSIARDGLMFFSPYVFPVYRLDRAKNSVVEDNAPMASALLALIIGMVWGLLFPMFFTPNYIGLIVAVLCCTSAILLSMHAIRRTAGMAGEACEIIDDEHR